MIQETFFIGNWAFMYGTEKQVLRLEHGSGSDESDQPTDGHGEVLFNVLFNGELINFFSKLNISFLHSQNI